MNEKNLFRLAMFAGTMMVVVGGFFLGGVIENEFFSIKNEYSVGYVVNVGFTVSIGLFLVGKVIRMWKQDILARLRLFAELPRVPNMSKTGRTYRSWYIDKYRCTHCELVLDPDSPELDEYLIHRPKVGKCGKKVRTVPHFIRSGTKAQLKRVLGMDIKDFLNREINLDQEVDVKGFFIYFFIGCYEKIKELLRIA